jgi:hypothetical protein
MGMIIYLQEIIMIKKIFLLTMLIIFVLSCSISEPELTWVEPPRYVIFTDTDQQPDEIGGTVVIIPSPKNLDSVEYFSVFWGTLEDDKAQHIGDVFLDGINEVYLEIPENTPLTDKINLNVLSRREDYEATRLIGDQIEDISGPVPDYLPQAISFTDENDQSGYISGDIIITMAQNESAITHYVAFLGNSANEVTGDSIGSVAVSGADTVIELNDPVAITEGAYITVKTRNEFGISVFGVSQKINDAKNVELGVTFELEVEEIQSYVTRQVSNRDEYLIFRAGNPEYVQIILGSTTPPEPEWQDYAYDVFDILGNIEIAELLESDCGNLGTVTMHHPDIYPANPDIDITFSFSSNLSTQYRNDNILYDDDIMSFVDNLVVDSGYGIVIPVEHFTNGLSTDGVTTTFNNDFSYTAWPPESQNVYSITYAFRQLFLAETSFGVEMEYIYNIYAQIYDHFPFTTTREKEYEAKPYYKVNTVTVTKDDSNSIFQNIYFDSDYCYSYNIIGNKLELYFHDIYSEIDDLIFTFNVTNPYTGQSRYYEFEITP